MKSVHLTLVPLVALILWPDFFLSWHCTKNGCDGVFAAAVATIAITVAQKSVHCKCVSRGRKHQACLLAMQYSALHVHTNAIFFAYSNWYWSDVESWENYHSKNWSTCGCFYKQSWTFVYCLNASFSIKHLRSLCWLNSFEKWEQKDPLVRRMQNRVSCITVALSLHLLFCLFILSPPSSSSFSFLSSIKIESEMMFLL